MALISKATIQEVNDKLDALSVAEDYIRLEKKGGRYWGLCPFHNEKTPSFTVDPDRKIYHCFGCGVGGGIINFVMEMDKLTFPEAVETLARRMGIEIVYENSGAPSPEDGQRIKQDELAELYRRVTVSFHHFLTKKTEGEAALHYIVARGISAEMIDRFRLGYAPANRLWLFRFLSQKGYSGEFLAASGLFSPKYPQSSFFSDRLMFPIADRQGRTVAFGGRILGGEGPKYVNSRESTAYKKGQTLFAIDLALPEIRKTHGVYLAEGYMDVIALHQAGITNAVAPLGTAFTDDQAKLLRRWAEKAFLVFDSDEAGQNAAVKAILTCRKNSLSCAVVIPGGENQSKFKDPADILQENGPEALHKSMKCFINDFEYLVNRAKSLYDISALEGKARAVAFLFPWLETLDSDVSRDDGIGAIADAFEADRPAVLNDYRKRNASRRPQREEAASGEKPVQMNDELFLLTVVSVNLHLYPNFRKALGIGEIEDTYAKELFVALEECFVNEELGIDTLLSRISSAPLRNFIAGRGTSPEFSGDAAQLIADGIKRVKGKRLRRRRAVVVTKLRNAKGAASGDGPLDELLAEKMHIDTELRELEGR
ncbi:MAG: DNA primase [Treponema sp.]|jgi:DNA primase|nr:DNA primase [Treponema sp.]